MPTIPFRGLAARGILKDPAPYQLELNAWSDGNNMRFHGSKASRAPAFRTVYDALPILPLHEFGVRPPTGGDAIYMVGDNQAIWKWSGGTVANLSPTAPPYVPVATSGEITTVSLGQVVYVNDAATQPLCLAPTDTVFRTLPGWDPTWSCRSLRTFGNQMVALHVTKGSSVFGNLVKISDLALNGLPPASWDHTDTTKSALENPIENLRTPLVDGVALRNAFILYSNDEVWAMEPVGGVLLYTFRALFHEGGALSTDCVVDVDGKHYVFGPNDIYVHDGVSKQSIIDGKNRDAVFQNLSTDASRLCFATYMARYNTIMFAYRTGPGEAAWPPGSGCNKGAVYDLAGGTWSFVDLPNVTGCTAASVTGAYTYATLPAGSTYANMGGSYWDQQSTTDAHIIMSASIQTGYSTASRLLGYDYPSKGNLPMLLCPEADFPSFIERRGLSLDTEGADLTTAKMIRRIFPQAQLYGPTPITVQIGGANTPEGPYKLGPIVSFDPATQYKVDVRQTGRYLLIRFTQNANEDWTLPGFDADIVSNGNR